MFKYLLILALCLPIFKASGTTQAPDRIIIDGNTFNLATLPFEMLDSVRYKKFQQQVRKGNSRKINAHETVYTSSSSLWRGYVATWELRNDSLIFHSAVNLEGKPITIPEIIVPGAFAGWFSGELLIRSGKDRWSDDDNGFREYEFETAYTVRDGRVDCRQGYMLRHREVQGKSQCLLEIDPETAIL